MPQDAPNYDVLAQAHGGTPTAAVDYDALAQAHGATPQTPADFTTRNALDEHGQPVVHSWTDKAIAALPWLGGLIGGVGGGVGGTAFGLGFGGVPGAVGGAAAGGAAGEALKENLNRLRGNPAPASPAAAAGQIGAAAALQGGGELVGQGVAKAASLVAPRIMQAAVKPGLKSLLSDLRAGREMPAVVKTLLDEGVNVTQNGLAKLHLLFDQTNDSLKAALANATGTVEPIAVASRLTSTAKTFANQVNPVADLGSVSKVGEEFLAEHGPMSVADAQALKVGTYKQIGKKYGQLSSADVEAQKALARGLKEEIEKEVPSIAGLNAREGALIQAIDQVGKRVALSGNRDPVGFAWVAHNPVMFLSSLFDRSPVVKSLVARGLYVQAGASAKVAPELIRTAVSALASSGQPDDAPQPPSPAK